MKPTPPTFLKKLTITTLVLIGIILFVFYFLLPSFYIPVFLFLLFFVSAFTYFSFKWLVKTVAHDFGRFIRKIMVVTVLRLFVYILLTVFYALVLNKDLLVFIVAFGIIYLIFISLEVYELILGSGRVSTETNKKN
jgi:hypothetical protein